MTQGNRTADRTPTTPPEPSQKSQVDIANDVQDGLRQANDDKQSRTKSVGKKATQFDGNPNPESDEGGVFSPPDDTPAVLPKKEGV